MEDRSTTALIALRRILRVTELNARKLAHESDLTTSQLLVLEYVARRGRTLPSSIAKAVDLRQATISVLVDKLEAAGFVTRTRDTEDRRRVWVELTASGRQVLDQSPDLLQTRFESGFRNMEAWEQALIIAALERVASLLDADSIDAAPVLDVGDLDRRVNQDSDQTDS